MKFLKLAVLVAPLLVFSLTTGCANTDDVDDSDVTSDGESSGSVDDGDVADSSSDDGEVSDAPAAAPVATTKGSGKGHEARGEGATMLYNIASAALKKSDNTLSYSVKCTYVIKPLSIKACMVKTGFLPADAKTKVGKLLLEAKNLPRKKSSATEATVTTNYSCTKGKSAADTVCNLEKAR